MVTIEALGTVQQINQSKVRREHDEWHDVPLPCELEQPGSSTDSGTQHETSHSDPVPQSEPQGDVLALWHNHSPHLMELGHVFPTVSANCVRHGLAVAEPIDLNSMPDVTTQSGQTQIANLVVHRDPSILFVNPIAPTVPGWTDDMRAIQLASR